MIIVEYLVRFISMLALENRCCLDAEIEMLMFAEKGALMRRYAPAPLAPPANGSTSETLRRIRREEGGGREGKGEMHNEYLT